jgi:hypothetical protein
MTIDSEEKNIVVDRKIVFDTAVLDTTVVSEDNDTLTMSAVIASEIVHKYDGLLAYKPAVELEKMAHTASRVGSVPIMVMKHPGADTDYLLIKHNDVHGRASNFQYVKDLKDPKTKRPNRRGVKADITWFKDSTPPKVIDGIKNGALRDVSIGFTCEIDFEEGTFNGDHYDYVQRNMFLNHVAAPVEAGRCPGPVCGIGVDSRKSESKLHFVDVQVLESCPVCAHMKDVGWQEAGKRLYEAYGPDVLEVIDTGYLPPQLPTEPPQQQQQQLQTLQDNSPQPMRQSVESDVAVEAKNDKEFFNAFRELKKALS